jgi:hypothetical protein
MPQTAAVLLRAAIHHSRSVTQRQNGLFAGVIAAPGQVLDSGKHLWYKVSE